MALVRLALRRFILSFLFLFTSSVAGANSPFSEACQAPIASNESLTSSWLNFSYHTEDMKKRQSRDLLMSVLRLAQEKILRDLTFSANIQSCLSEDVPSPQCAELRDFADVHLVRLVQDARLQLILAQSPVDPMAGMGRTDTQPNYRMRSYGVGKLKAWDPATPKEKQMAAEVLKKYRSEIIEHYLKKWNQDKYLGRYAERQVVDASLRHAREAHFRQYRSFFGAAPFLHYFHSANPDRKEVLSAFSEFDVNTNAELVYLNSLYTELESQDVSRFSDAIAASLQYSSYLEFQLLQAPEYCGLAISLFNTYSKRSLGFTVAVGLPLLVGSIFAPEIVAYPLGIVASGYFALAAYNDYELARIRALSVLLLDPGFDANADFTAAQNNFGTQVLLFPFSFVGGRIFGTSLRSFAAGTTVANKALNSAVYLPKKLLEISQKYSRQRLVPALRD